MAAGVSKITADGLVDSTNATRVYEVIVVNTDNTAPTVKFLNGTAGSEYVRVKGATVNSTCVSFPGGMLFNAGCYVDVDAHTAWVTVIYSRE